MKAGFVGLGALGKSIARRLIVEGVELVVWNRTAEKALGLAVRATDIPAELIEESDIIFLCLLDSAAVESVLLGQDGLTERDCTNKVIIDMTTNRVGKVVDFYRAVAERGGHYVECPVLGSVSAAGQGALSLLVGGDKAAVDRIIPFIEKIAQHIFYFEEQGLATKMKLIDNLVVGSFMAALAEAFACGEGVGLSKTRVLDILAAGAGDSAILTTKKEKLLREDFAPDFSVALMHKDLDSLREVVADLGVSGPMLRTVSGLYEAAMARYARLDVSSVYKVLKG